jgi:enamine deaminase RidA (YjgF/YER057c/UK114 family)
LSGGSEAAGEGPVERLGEAGGPGGGEPVTDTEATGAGTVERLAGDPPSPFEEQFGYSRVAVAGDFVLIGGTTSVDPSGAVLGITGYEQTIEILRKIEHELSRVGCGLGSIIQIRTYVTDISRGEEVGRAFAEILGLVAPIMTMVEVSSLYDPRMLVEIETVAYRG